MMSSRIMRLRRLPHLARAFCRKNDEPLTPLDNSKSGEKVKFDQMVGYKTLHDRMKAQADLLEKSAESQSRMAKYEGTHLDEVYDLTIYFDPLDHKSQKSHAILNYYKVSYKKNMNKVYTERMKKQLKKSGLDNIDEFQFPAMKAILNMEMDQWYFGEDKILQYLLKHRMIGLMPHRSNTAWAHQGCEMIEKKIVEPLQALFWSPMLNLELSFYGNVEVFTNSGGGFPGLLFAWLGFKRFMKSFAKGVPKIIMNRQQFAESKDKFLEGLKEFNGRLGKNPYHGGQQPDEADFLMYGVIKSKDVCSSFHTFLEQEMPRNMTQWLYRMEVDCKRETRDMMF